jgi:hypothetical protein
MVVKILNTILTPSPQISLLGGRRCGPILLAQSLQIRGRVEEAVYIIFSYLRLIFANFVYGKSFMQLNYGRVLCIYSKYL